MAGPVRLTPSLREKVWGRTRLMPWFPDSEEPIGEVWYLADRDLPLLVKLLFTSQKLSVQVHPADGEAGPRGKTEMWHILEAAPGASIALGFREPIGRQRLLDAARSGSVEELLNWIPVHPGETYFTPAHTVHAIGAGIVLFEIQQNSDVTYRLWDYGRPREIHVDQAAAIADLSVHPGAVPPRRAGPLGVLRDGSGAAAGGRRASPRAAGVPTLDRSGRAGNHRRPAVPAGRGVAAPRWRDRRDRPAHARAISADLRAACNPLTSKLHRARGVRF